MSSTAYNDQFTEHPNDGDYRNRAERAEQECQELRDGLKAAADEINGLKDALAQVPNLANQDADSEIARLREYLDKHSILSTNRVPTFDIGLEAADEIVIQRLRLCYEWMLKDMAKPNVHPEDMAHMEKDLLAIMRVYEFFTGSELDEKRTDGSA